MKITILAFGKLKTPGLREAADYYLKLIQPWIEVRELELKPIELKDKSPENRKIVQSKESQILLKEFQKLPHPSAIIFLDEKGKPLSTQQWKNEMENFMQSGIKTILICIGSSIGFDESLKHHVKLKISLGPQTLSHELARTVLVEQLYRTWSVMKGHPYHVEGS